jgi:lipopolysaccharide biosynthesis glycosyltransferase
VSSSNPKTAILTVATGKYFGFLNQLLSGIETNNISASEITVFVFTDETKEITNTKLNVVKVFWDKTNWPDPTLLRYHGFLLIESVLAKFDQILYLDVDMQVKSQLPIAISQKLVLLHLSYLI